MLRYLDYVIKRSYEENISIIYFNSLVEVTEYSRTTESVKIKVEKSLISYLNSEILPNQQHVKFENFTSAIKINCIFLEKAENKESDYIIYINCKDFKKLKEILWRKKEKNFIMVENDKVQETQTGFEILIK